MTITPHPLSSRARCDAFAVRRRHRTGCGSSGNSQIPDQHPTVKALRRIRDERVPMTSPRPSGIAPGGRLPGGESLGASKDSP